jgi:hypothetical protein
MASKTPKSAATPKVAALKAVPAARKPDAPAQPRAVQTLPAAPLEIAATSATFGDDALDTDAQKGDSYKLKELISAVTEKTGTKKKDAKELVEAVLAELAHVLGRGQSLSLPPLGNIRVAKSEDRGGAQMLVLKLRLGGGAGGGANGAKQALAQDGEDS